jgi:hypothetical protein
VPGQQRSRQAGRPAGLGISALSRHTLTLNAPGQFAVLYVEGFPILRHWYVIYPGVGRCR